MNCEQLYLCMCRMEVWSCVALDRDPWVVICRGVSLGTFWDLSASQEHSLGHSKGNLGTFSLGFPGRVQPLKLQLLFTFWPEALQRCVNSCEPSLLSGHGALVIKHFFNVCNTQGPQDTAVHS